MQRPQKNRRVPEQLNSALEVKRGIISNVEHISGKYALWGTVAAAVLTAAVALYIHYDGKSEQKKAEELQRKADKSEKTANLTISNVYLPPINTNIESAFFAEITNNSLNVADDVQVKINFGEATVSKCETLPIDAFQNQKEFTSSIVSFSIEKLQKKIKYIYTVYYHIQFSNQY
ncbi:MAG: hypothetical protein QM504_16215 [Pseudomonadota bacterium]